MVRFVQILQNFFATKSFLDDRNSGLSRSDKKPFIFQPSFFWMVRIVQIRQKTLFNLDFLGWSDLYKSIITFFNQVFLGSHLNINQIESNLSVPECSIWSLFKCGDGWDCQDPTENLFFNHDFLDGQICPNRSELLSRSDWTFFNQVSLCWSWLSRFGRKPFFLILVQFSSLQWKWGN